MVDGAVSLELVSSVKSSQKFPASREKNREFAEIRVASGRKSAGNSPLRQGFSQKFPAHESRKFFCLEQGNSEP